MNRVRREMKRAARGFTIVEAMIALVLVGILLAGLVELFVATKRNARAATELSRLQETGRVAIQLLANDVRRAGHLGATARLEYISGSLGPAPITSTCPAGNNRWGRMVGQVVFGKNDTRAGYGCLPAEDHLRGDILTVRFAGSTAIADADMVNGRLYLRSSAVDGRIFRGSQKDDAENQLLDVSSETFELFAHSYFVGPSGRSCNGQAIPSLWRKTVGDNGRPISEELLAGVEQMQLRYSENGSFIDADEVSDWDSVAAVEIQLLVRAECPETGFTDSQTYAMGDIVGGYNPGGAFRRQLFSTITMLRNRG